MRHLIFILLIFFFSGLDSVCQFNSDQTDSYKIITQLRNHTFEIREFSNDSLLLYKGILSTNVPETRQGKFYFFNSQGKVYATGYYREDVPFGTWVYYDSSMDTVQVIDYSRVWNFLQENANIKLENSNLMELKTKYKRGILPDGSFSNSEIPPTFNRNSGYDNFNDFVKKNMVYPPYANCKGIYGEVDIQFVVDREGKIRKPEIFNSWYSDLNIEAIRVLSESPPWKPGLQDNIPLNIQCNWRFNFSQDGLFSAQPIEFSDNVNAFSDDSVLDKRDEEIFYLVEDMPRFDNGDPSVTFTKYIENNLHYPENAIKNSKSGRVILQFIVTGTGEVKDVVLVSPLDPEMDAEAKRVVMSSPQWTPGRQRGKPATVLFTFPVDFILDKENDGK